jgi:hypothetical protein
MSIACCCDACYGREGARSGPLDGLGSIGVLHYHRYISYALSSIAACCAILRSPPAWQHEFWGQPTTEDCLSSTILWGKTELFRRT